MSRRHALSAIFAVVMLGVAPAHAAQRPLRVEAEDVSSHPKVTVTVTVPFEVAAGPVPEDAFTLSEEGTERPVTVESLRGSALDVIVVMDTTGSMGGAPIAEAKAAAISFLNKLPQGTSVSVMGYDTKPYRASPFGTDIGRHARAIRGLRAGGETALYDAVAGAVDTFARRRPAERAIVLLSDGEDNASSASLGEVKSKLAASNVRMFGVEYRTAFTDELGLRGLVSATGGRVVRAGEPQGLVRVYGEIAAELSNQYRLTYTSQSAGPTEIDVQLSTGAVDAFGTIALRLPEPVSPPPPPAAPEQAPLREAPNPAPPPPTDLADTFANRWLFVSGLGLVFVATALMGLYLFVPTRKRINILSAGRAGERQNMPKMREGLTDLASHLTDVAEKSLSRRSFGAKLNSALERAGINLRPAEFTVLAASLALTGFALGTLLASSMMGLFFAILVLFATRIYVSFKGSRRQSKFADQLNDTLQLLAGSLRAGYGMMQAIDSVAREANSPTAEEFSRLVVEARLGRDLTAAMQAMGERIGSEDLEWVIQAIAIHREVGGDLAEVLDTVAGTIRERNQIRRQIKALAAEGKLSGIILTLLPLAVAALIGATNPGYMKPLFESFAGIAALTFGFCLMAAGGLWMRHFINLKF